MAKILLVEDDLSIAANLKAWLEKENHVVDHVADGDQGFEMLTHFQYDLAVLDWQLPGMQGADICAELRKNGNEIAILMLTSRSSLDDRVKGLDSGAYDYLVKPCSLEELSARIRALLRRHGHQELRVFLIGDLEVRFESHEVIKDGKDIQLSPMEFEILKLLARNQDTFFSADMLLSRLWADKPQVSKQLVKVHVKNLRKKLAACGTNVSVITSKNEGYTLQIAADGAGPASEQAN